MNWTKKAFQESISRNLLPPLFLLWWKSEKLVPLCSTTSSWSNLSKDVSSNGTCVQFSGNTNSMNFPVTLSATFIGFPVGKYWMKVKKQNTRFVGLALHWLCSPLPLITCSCYNLKQVFFYRFNMFNKFMDIFRTLSNSYDGIFYENKYRLFS